MPWGSEASAGAVLPHETRPPPSHQGQDKKKKRREEQRTRRTQMRGCAGELTKKEGGCQSNTRLGAGGVALDRASCKRRAVSAAHCSVVVLWRAYVRREGLDVHVPHSLA